MLCEHDDKTGSYNMYWYQQKPDGMKLIALSYGMNTPTVEEEFRGKWEMTRPDTLYSQLIKKETAAEDMAVYFCASSEHSHKYQRMGQHKTITLQYLDVISSHFHLQGALLCP
uniref:Ig-like domain-containing protein n=1 Tax=Pyxicephalus adspersus TaxID=30357 RepID=A0AAV2ZGU5_PYXAD|nr:TPA: hypothetical protein GDO54_004072 [Pyxicephalus adspersus]